MKKGSLFIALLISLFSLTAYLLSPLLGDTPVQQLPPDVAAFYFLDVGQGDCTFISDGETNILIDSGTTESGGKIYSYLKNLGIRNIDIFIGTHPHEDHLGGAASVLSSIDVSKVFLNGEASSLFFYEDLLDTLIKKEITPVIPETNCIYECGAFRIKFLTGDEDFGDANNNSLTAMVSYGDVKALFTGDCEKEVETHLIESGVKLDADILKVGHHGSRYASTDVFLKAVSPSVAVIQSEEGNSYGHPHEEALRRLEASGAEILRNDKSGDIIITTDGKSISDSYGNTFERVESSVITLTYIGNKKSRTFHNETCSNLPSKSNVISFVSREEAVQSGYKPCGNCCP